VLNPHWAVGDDGALQWLLLRRAGLDWHPRRFHIERDALLHSIRELCGMVDMAGGRGYAPGPRSIGLTPSSPGGATMARRRSGRGVNSTGRSKCGGQFVPIPYDMAECGAWRSLSGPAIKVYVELRRRYNGGNNGDLSLSLDEAARLLNPGKATVARALAELEAKGFLRMTARGRWYGRQATTYAVTDRQLGNNPPTNAWRAWQPSPKNHSSVLKRTDADADGSATEPRL
jgi:hypothetical protein